MRLLHLIVATTGLLMGLELYMRASAYEIPSSQQASKVAIPNVTAIVAAEAEITTNIVFSGTLVPREEFLVTPEVSGSKVKAINTTLGSWVNKGDVIAIMDDQILRAETNKALSEYRRAERVARKARAQIDFAKASQAEADAALNRMEELGRTGSASLSSQQERYQSALTARSEYAAAVAGASIAEAEVMVAKANYELAAHNLSRTKIRAPTSGIISERRVQHGEISSAAGAPMFRITKDGEIEVEAQVIETDIGRVREGQDVEISISGAKSVRGTVRIISPVVDQTTRHGSIRLSIQSDEIFMAGSFASGLIFTRPRNAIVVPASAIIADQGSQFVQVVNNQIIEKRPITIGVILDDGSHEVIQGLTLGDQIVLQSNAFFSNGDIVNPIIFNEPVGFQ